MVAVDTPSGAAGGIGAIGPLATEVAQPVDREVGDQLAGAPVVAVVGAAEVVGDGLTGPAEIALEAVQPVAVGARAFHQLALEPVAQPVAVEVAAAGADQAGVDVITVDLVAEAHQGGVGVDATVQAAGTDHAPGVFMKGRHHPAGTAGIFAGPQLPLTAHGAHAAGLADKGVERLTRQAARGAGADLHLTEVGEGFDLGADTPQGHQRQEDP